MKTGYVVADVMTTKPVTCTRQLAIRDCASLMKQHEIGSVLIVEDGELLGIVTDKDFVYRAVADGVSLDEPVARIMSPIKYTVSPGTDIIEAIKLLNKYGIRHLPVLDDHKLAGYVTLTTILKIEPQLFDLVSEKIELRGISPSSPIIGVFDAELESGPCESCGNYASTLFDDDAGRLVCGNCLQH